MRKRDGKFVYGTGDLNQRPSKSQRLAKAAVEEEVAQSAKIRALSAKSMTVGMSLLGVVTLSSAKKVEIALPGGTKAVADPFEVLVDDTSQTSGQAWQSGRTARSRDNFDELSSNSDDDEVLSQAGSSADSSDELTDPQSSTRTVRTLHESVSPCAVVRVAVVSVEKNSTGHWKVLVSCRPSLINVDVGVVGTNVAGSQPATVVRKGDLIWGAVKSVEDHGYIIDFGASVRAVGFLRFSDVVPERRLYPGYPVEVVSLDSECRGKGAKKVITVSHERKVLNNATVEHASDIALSSLRAGLKVRAQVVHLHRSGGVLLKVCGMFLAVVDRHHVPKEVPNINDTIDCRLLYVDASSKSIGATLLHSLVKERLLPRIPKNWEVGRVLRPLVVERVDIGYGVTLTPVEPEKMMNDDKCDSSTNLNITAPPLFAHVSRLSDGHVMKLEKRFSPNTLISAGARIVSFSPVDGVVNVDMRPTTLSRKVLTISEVRAGERYDCRILSHMHSSGLIVGVDCDNRIRGVVPAVYLTDASVSASFLSKNHRFAVGSVLRCVCIFVAKEHDKIVLASKASLVSSKYQSLTSYEEAKQCLDQSKDVNDCSTRGCVFDGTVSRITRQQSILVSFCNGVRGLIPRSELVANRSIHRPVVSSKRMVRLSQSNTGESNVRTDGDCSDQIPAESVSCNDNRPLTKSQIEALYPVGRTVPVRVVRVDCAARKITLSLDLDSRSNEDCSLHPKTPTAQNLVGKLVGGSVRSVDAAAKLFNVTINSFYEFKNSERSSSEDEGSVDNDTEAAMLRTSINCVLPFAHLSDFAVLSSRMVEMLTKSVAGTGSPFPLTKALVLAVNGGTPTLTLKSSLIDAVEKSSLPRTFGEVAAMCGANRGKTKSPEGSDANCAQTSVSESEATAVPEKVNHCLRGYVKAALPTGLVIGFLGNLVEFVRKSRIADEFISDPTRVVQPHDSVCVLVESIDHSRERFNLSLRSSDIGTAAVACDTAIFFNYFSQIGNMFGLPRVEEEFPVGSVVDSVFDESRTYGKVLKLTSSRGSTAVGVVLEEHDSSTQDAAHENPVGPTSATDAMGESGASASAVARDTSVRTDNVQRSDARGSSRRTRRQKSGLEKAMPSVNSARVLDVDPFTGVVDVTLDSSLIDSASRRSPLKAGKTFSATILLVNDEYVVLSVSRTRKTTIAFALLPTLYSRLSYQFRRGSKISCAALESKLQRSLVVVHWAACRAALSVDVKSSLPGLGLKVRRRDMIDPTELKSGSLISGKVSATLPFQVNVAVCPGVIGRLHAAYNCDVPGESVPLGILSTDDLGVGASPAVGDKLHGLHVLSVRNDGTVLDENLDAKEGKNAGDFSCRRNSKVLELAYKQFSTRSLPPLSVGNRTVAFFKSCKTHTSGQVPGFYCFLSPNLVGYCDRVDALTPCELSKRASFLRCAGSDGSENDLCSQKPGAPMLCQIISAPSSSNAVATVVCSENGNTANVDDVAASSFHGIVISVRPGDGLRVEMPWFARPSQSKQIRSGLVNICDVDDNFDRAVEIMEEIKVGDIVRVKRVSNPSDSAKRDVVYLTMRSSEIDTGGADNDGDIRVQDRLIIGSVNEEDVGCSLRGFVRRVSKEGCFVSIGRSLVARVLLSDLADRFVKEPSAEFPEGMLVSGRICQVNKSDPSRVGMSLRKTEKKILKEQHSESKARRETVGNRHYKEGEVVHGVIRRIEKLGAVLRLAGNASAVLHVREADQDRTVSDPWSEWQVGQALCVVVISSDESKNLRVGSKRCYFEAAGMSLTQVESVLANNERKVMHGLSGDVGTLNFAIDEASFAGTNTSSSDDDSLSESADSICLSQESNEIVEQSGGDRRSSADENDKMNNDAELDGSLYAVTALPIADDFSFEDVTRSNSEMWEENRSTFASGDHEHRDDLSEPSSDDDEATRKKRKKSSKETRAKKRAKIEAEKEIQAREEALAKSSDSPQTADDFERLIMAQPNASHVWIRYIAFRMSLAQFDKARAVAERALETIALTEEVERVNIWIAYINLEASHGKDDGVGKTDPTTSLRDTAAAVFRVFDRACQRVTDLEDLHLRAAAAVRQSHPDISREILRRGLRNFKTSKAVWEAVGTHQFTSGNVDDARKTLERALLSLDKREHVALIMKFAQLEYRCGSVERGRTVFESLIGNFPKKLDLWSVYMDMEIGLYRRGTKHGNTLESKSAVESSRRVFERCLTLDFSTKKMKFIFKRWLAFETEIGDKSGQDSVRAKARQYVENKMIST